MSNKYIITSNGSFVSQNDLCHSSRIRYIDLNENELIHWKYIKREKLPNGKYRYYYDESELDAAKDVVDYARTMHLKALAGSDNAMQDVNSAKRRLNGDGKVKKNYDRAVNNLSKAQKYENFTAKVLNRAVDRYEAKKISSFGKRTISKGAVAVANWISDLGSSSKKKKKKKAKV